MKIEIYILINSDICILNRDICIFLTFIVISHLIKSFPIWYNANFEAIFLVFLFEGNSFRINFTPYGIFLLFLLIEIKFEIWRVTFWKKFSH